MAAIRKYVEIQARYKEASEAGLPHEQAYEHAVAKNDKVIKTFLATVKGKKHGEEDSNDPS